MKVFLITICLWIFLFLLLLWGGSYPKEVLNTFEAIDWCEENKNITVSSGLTCVYCVEEYLEYHNLTKKEFPTYCWSSSESPPNRLELTIKKFFGG